MVDVAAWLRLLDDQERERQTRDRGLLGPYNFDVGPVKVPNPLAQTAVAFERLGAASEGIQNTTLRPLMGGLAAIRDAMYNAAGVPQDTFIPDPSLAVVGRQQAPPELSVGGLADYSRQGAEQAGIGGQIAEGILTDPLTYLGGPLGKVGEGIAQVPKLGRAGRALSAADAAYVDAIGEVAGFVGQTLKAGASRVPGLKAFTEAGPLARASQYQGDLETMLRSGTELLREKGLTFADLARPPRLDITVGRKAWSKTIAPSWAEADRQIVALDHPAKQIAMLELRQQAAKYENYRNTLGNQQRMALLDHLHDDPTAEKVVRAQINRSWEDQQKDVRAIQIGLFDAIDEMKARPAAGLGPAGAALQPAGQTTSGTSISPMIEQALDSIRARHSEARTVGAAMRGTMDPATAAYTPGIWDARQVSEAVTGEMASDPAYREAYAQTLDTLQKTITSATGPHLDPNALQSVREVVDATYQATRDQLGPAIQPIEQTMAGLSDTAKTTLMNVWDNAERSLPKALNQVLATRDRVAAPGSTIYDAVYRWHSEQNATMPQAQRLLEADLRENVDAIFANKDRLLNDAAMLDPKNESVRAAAEKLLNRYGKAVDPLQAEHTGRAAMGILAKQEAARLGIKNPPPWLAPFTVALGSWKELALLSVRFPFQNALSQWFLSHLDDVSVGRVLGMQAEKVKDLRRGVVTNTFDQTASPSYSIWRGRNGTLDIPEHVTGHQGEAQHVAGATVGQTAIGRIPLAIRAGVPALATGAGAYNATPEDDPNRWRNTALGALLGGAFGAAAPRFVAANGLLSRVLETGARGAAFLTGVEQHMGTLTAAGKGDGLLKQVYDNLDTALLNDNSPVIGKRAIGTAGLTLGNAPLPGGIPASATVLNRLPAPPGIPLGSASSPLGTITRPGHLVNPDVLDPAANTFNIALGAKLPDVTHGTMTKAQALAVRDAFARAGGQMSPGTLAELAVAHGATPAQASRARALLDEALVQAETQGTELSNRINFDYSDVSKGVQALRESGVFPFITFQSKFIPKMATIMLQHPGFMVAIDQMNTLTDADIAEGNLTGRFERLAKMGALGSYLADHVLGRNGMLFGNPLSVFLPLTDMGRDLPTGEGTTPLDTLLAAGQTIGLGPSPLVTLPLQAVGAIGERAPTLYRTSPYLAGAMQTLTGIEADPEQLTKQLMRSARQATGASTTPTVTGDPLKDRAIRQRIAEMAVEETGKPPSGAYRSAQDDPESPIWQRAQREVERQRTGQTILSATLPFRTAFLSDTEAALRARQGAQGVAPSQIGDLVNQPATQAEIAAAVQEMKTRPLRQGETLQDRVVNRRLSAQYQQAEKRDPLTGALSLLGGRESDTLNRQRTDYFAYQKRVAKMPASRRAALLNDYLATRPVLRRWLAESRAY